MRLYPIHRRFGKRVIGRRTGGVVIIMLLIGSSREQVMKTVDLAESAVRKIIGAFNAYGPNGLIAKKLMVNRRRIAVTEGPRRKSTRLHGPSVRRKSFRDAPHEPAFAV